MRKVLCEPSGLQKPCGMVCARRAFPFLGLGGPSLQDPCPKITVPLDGGKRIPLLAVSLSLALTLLSPSGIFALGDQVEIDGLVMEEVKTPFGQEFYHHFVIYWEAIQGELEGMSGYNLDIIEWPSPQWGSLMQIRVNEALVYQTLLQPRSEAIEESAKKAVQAIKRYLLQSQMREEKEERPEEKEPY